MVDLYDLHPADCGHPCPVDSPMCALCFLDWLRSFGPGLTAEEFYERYLAGEVA